LHYTSGIAAMEVCFLASGNRLTVLDADEFEGKEAKEVKVFYDQI